MRVGMRKIGLLLRLVVWGFYCSKPHLALSNQPICFASFGSRTSRYAVLARLQHQRNLLFQHRPDIRSVSRHVLPIENNASAETNSNDSSHLSDRIVQALDLALVLGGVADHAGTRRGREALLSHTGHVAPAKSRGNTAISLSNQRRFSENSPSQYRHNINSNRKRRVSTNNGFLAPVAHTALAARSEYELVEQAALALDGTHHGVTYPPLYGADSSPWDSKSIPDTDHDEWLDMPLIDEWTLEHILQADQVVQMLLNVHEWADRIETQTWTPGLSDIGRDIAKADLLLMHADIKGTIEVVRQRTMTDPFGKSSFTFRFCETKFPSLTLLREKERHLMDMIETEMSVVLQKQRGSPEPLEYQGRMVVSIPKSNVSSRLGVIRGTSESGGQYYVEPHNLVALGDQLASVRNDLAEVEKDIQDGLIRSVMRASVKIDKGIMSMARLDVIFAKAAFGSKMNGVIPTVKQEGTVNVQGFLHPVLLLRRSDPRSVVSDAVVPIDLVVFNDSNARALIISGPNGGGKTIALKSFGLVCILAKLGIPIPVSNSDTIPRVDFFENLLVEVGDQQNVMEGESTLMARLNACAAAIQSLVESTHESTQLAPTHSMVLLDELGGGTDPSAGGAIAQAVLEKLLENKECRIVATTHSSRLKALSFESDNFDCATVLLKHDESSEYKRPTFQLQYGLIGDSYALGAASRCIPPLPEDVLSRAAGLIASVSSNDAPDGEHIRALISSLDKQLVMAEKARMLAENIVQDGAMCRDALASLASAYEQHLTALEQRLETIHRELIEDESQNTLELVGESLATLRVIKKKIKSDEELLRERGLRIVPLRYEFQERESVIVVAKGPWEGMVATVRNSEVGLNEVTVVPSESTWDDSYFSPIDLTSIDETLSKPLMFKRHEVAIWDFESVWDEYEGSKPVISVRESREKLNNLLSILGNNSSRSPSGDRQKTPKINEFTSSRQRKAANTKKKKSLKRK